MTSIFSAAPQSCVPSILTVLFPQVEAASESVEEEMNFQSWYRASSRNLREGSQGHYGHASGLARRLAAHFEIGLNLCVIITAREPHGWIR